jgi:hypothetical protein
VTAGERPWTNSAGAELLADRMFGAGVLANFVRREAYVLSYIDAFWLTAWVSLLGILLILLLRPPPPNPMIPSRGAS